jgi:hypothetical protein
MSKSDITDRNNTSPDWDNEVFACRPSHLEFDITVQEEVLSPFLHMNVTYNL